MNRPQVFLSYAWGGESEKLVNELDNAFKDKGIQLIRDKRDLGFKGMITEFIQGIGEGDAVITVISDKYLKSRYCMFELLEIYRNLKFAERIFPIILEDALIYEPVARLRYHRFWKDKKKELEDAVLKDGLDAITVIADEFIIYSKIFNNLGEITNILKEINTLTPNTHRADNFSLLIDEIQKLITVDKTQNKERVVEVNWDFIVRTIKRERCILFLGPELYRLDDSGKSKQQVFFENLARENMGPIVSYNQDGFFLFSNRQEKTRVLTKIIDFYEEHADEDVISKIAEIPFHTIVSINPDIAIKKFFLQHKYPHSFNFFDKNQKRDLTEAPTSKKPLIYNLLGSITKTDTLVLTHDDLFEYFKALLGNHVLPQELRTMLEMATEYIFLGFQFDKWYVQLILSLLNLHDEKYHFIRYALTNTLTNDTKSLCINHFRIEFIGTDNKEFLSALHERCKAAGILRNFHSVINEGFANERLMDIQQQLDGEYRLLAEHEHLLDIEKDPRNIMELEDTIEEINRRIGKYEDELKLVPAIASTIE